MTGALLFVAGLAVLLAGAEALVRGAARLATALGVSALGVGLTVVAFGTSAPELAVSVQAAFLGRNGGADIALGNVVGSNVFNVLFILGLSAAIVPLTVAQKLVRVDVPVMIAVAVLVLALGLDRRIGRLEGAALLALLAAYTVFCLRSVRRESADVRSEYEREYGVARPRGARSFALYALAITGAESAIPCQNAISSRGVRPAAMSAALIAPADVPESAIGPPANRGSVRRRS